MPGPGTIPVGTDSSGLYTVTPVSQNTISGTYSANYTIALTGGAVAPGGGYAFALSAVHAAGDTVGFFAPSTSVTIPAGSTSTSFTYEPLFDGANYITVTPPAGLSGAGTIIVADQAYTPSSVSYTFTPGAQSAVTGSASGLLTLALSSGVVAPSGGYTFALATNELSGGSFSSGASVTIPAGSSSVTFAYTSTSDGTFTLTATPPGTMGTAAQSALVTFAPPPLPVVPAGYTGRELDIRFYDANNKRLAVPQSWVDTLNFEIGEQGGMQTGSLQMLVPWEKLQQSGTEHVDIYLWGQLLYRGYVRQPQNEIGNPERSSPTLHGLMELLNGYMVRRDFGYAPAASPSQLFNDIASICVTRSGRMSGLVLDTTGVDALGLTCWGMQATGKSVPQALNSLCELFPQQLIWGCDVDALGNNRLYLRPRATRVGYTFAIGGKISAFVYPRDCTKIVNRIYLTGAKLDGTNGTNPSYANLLPNASFETGAPNNEVDGNLLVNPGFEDSSAFGTSGNPWITGGAAIDTATGHTGSNSCELNNDDIAEEYVYQEIGVAGSPLAVHASCWWAARTGVVWQPQIQLALYNGTSLIASSSMPAPTVDSDPVGYTYAHFQWDWTPAAGLTVTKLRVTYILTNESVTGFSGQTLVDDCSVWFDGPELAKSWRIAAGHNGAWSSIDWRNRDFRPYDGDVMLKATAVVTSGSGNYAQIATNVADRPKGQPSRAYFIQFYVWNGSGSVTHAAAVATVIKSGAIQTGSPVVGSTIALAPGAWTLVSMTLRSGPNCDAIEVGLRVFDSGVYYIDAAGMWADLTSAPPFYVPGDTFQAVRDIQNYTFSQIGSAAVNSQANWGEREAAVSNADIANAVDADAYAVSYFKANAVPAIQAKLSIKGATAPVGLDGQVRIINLPDEPPALTPARIRYQIGSSIDIQVDLNNERPQLENLLRLVAAGKA